MSTSGCLVVLLSFFVADNASSLPDTAGSLSLRQAFRTSEIRRQWYTDLQSAQAQSVKTGLPMVLHFEAEWCAACKTMSRNVLSQPVVTGRLGRSVIGVKIDADKSPDLIRKFNVAILPTDVLLDANGRILSQESGYRDLNKYVSTLETAGKSAIPSSDWLCNPNIKLSQEALAKAVGEKNCVISRRAGVIVGLGGYSPVSMTDGRKWVKGNRNYASIYRGVMYYMQDAEQLKQFEAAPEKYAPKLHGCDPVVLNSLGTPLPGIISLGAVVDGDLYFFASETSRDLFKKNPNQFLKADQLVRGEQLKTTNSCCCTN